MDFKCNESRQILYYRPYKIHSIVINAKLENNEHSDNTK